MILFKDLKSNYPVYILNKDEIEVTTGKVVSVSFPRMDMNAPGKMVVDVVIESGEKTATYAIPENLSVTYANNLVLSTEREGISREVEAMKNSAEQVIASVDRQKKIIEKSTEVLRNMNPELKQKMEYDDRLNKMENSIGEMKELLSSVIKELKG